MKPDPPQELSPVCGINDALKKFARRARRNVKSISHDTDLKVHRLRTDMKKVRSLLRLLNPAGESEYFAKARDSASKLKDVFARSRDLAVQNQIDARLQRKPVAHPDNKHPTAEECALARKQSKRLRDALNNLDLTRITREDIIARLQSTHAQCLTAMEQARQHPADSQEFHDWRKRVKDLWYQSESLMEFYPQAKSWIKIARKLSEILGEEHDLALALTRQSTPKSQEKIETKLAELRTSAFALGAVLRPDSPPSGA